MYFTKIELHNFGIYKGTHEMCLTNAIGSRNITLIGGLNGRGKTTFHDSILLALYGRLALKYIQEKAKSYEKLLLEHINKDATDDETYIAVSLCLDDGTKLRVKRCWSLRGAKVQQQMVVEKNGVIDKYLGENWNYYIEETLPFGIARFFFFNNEKITQLADDTSFEQIKNSIKSAIGIATIEKTIEHTEAVIRRKKSALQAYERDEDAQAYRLVEQQIQEIDARLGQSRVRANQLEAEYERISAEYEAREKAFWSSGGDLGRSRESIQQEMKSIQEKVKQDEDAMLQLAVDPSSPLFLCRDLVNQAFESELSGQQAENKLITDSAAIYMYNQLVERLNNSGLNDAELDIVKRIVNDVLLGHTNDSPEHKMPQHMSSTSIVLFQHLFAETFQGLEQQITQLSERIDTQENELMSLDAHLGETDEKSLAMQLYEALKGVEKELTETEIRLRQENEIIESLQRQRSQLVERRIQLLKKIAEKGYSHDDDARIVRYAVMSIEVLQEFKKRLQSEKLGRLSETATDCFHKLVAKDSLVGKICIDPETIDVTIQDYAGNVIQKNQLSAGEQQMFAISIIWSLALTSGYQAPVVIDTPMARLDSAHRSSFVSKYLPAASSQVIVLSTDEEIAGRYLDMIRDNVVDSYTLLYRDEEQCTSIIHGYFGEE